MTAEKVDSDSLPCYLVLMLEQALENYYFFKLYLHKQTKL